MAKSDDIDTRVVSARVDGALVRSITIDLTRGTNPQLQTFSDAIRYGLELVKKENAELDSSANKEQNRLDAEKFRLNRELKYKRDMLALDQENEMLKRQFGIQ